MEGAARGPSFVINDRYGAGQQIGEDEAPMHPYMTHELARIKIEEALEDAQRQRLANAARANRPGTIDAVPFRDRIARLFNGLPTLVDRSRPAGA